MKKACRHCLADRFLSEEEPQDVNLPAVLLPAEITDIIHAKAVRRWIADTLMFERWPTVQTLLVVTL